MPPATKPRHATTQWNSARKFIFRPNADGKYASVSVSRYDQPQNREVPQEGMTALVHPSPTHSTPHPWPVTIGRSSPYPVPTAVRPSRRLVQARARSPDGSGGRPGTTARAPGCRRLPPPDRGQVVRPRPPRMHRLTPRNAAARLVVQTPSVRPPAARRRSRAARERTSRRTGLIATPVVAARPGTRRRRRRSTDRRAAPCATPQPVGATVSSLLQPVRSRLARDFRVW